METFMLLGTIIFTVIVTLLSIKVYYHLTRKRKEKDTDKTLTHNTAVEIDQSTTAVEKNNVQVIPALSEVRENQSPERENATQIQQRHDTDGEEEKELTVKEKFYLFLEKGFCPELEEGVEDPMYKYTGGAVKDSDSGLFNPMDGFCPFRPMQEDEHSVDEEDEELKHSDNKPEQQVAETYKNEVDSLEQMIKIGMKNGGKCPFMAPNRQSCPFDFGMKDDVDSEEEADMPTGHGKNGPCPAMVGEDKNENQMPNPASNESHQAAGATTQSVRTTMELLKTNLTDREREEEATMCTEQMTTIMKLLHEQEMKLGVVSEMELQNQLKMYI